VREEMESLNIRSQRVVDTTIQRLLFQNIRIVQIVGDGCILG
jgi:hypothetical protein